MALKTDTGAGKAIRVAIVEDDRPTRDGLAMLINGTPGYRCVASYRSVEDALRSTVGEAPDVLLLDINLPGMLGSEGVKELKHKYSSMEILMLTVYAEQDKVFESICNGACGYLLKETPPARLLEAISEAYRGGSPMSPEIAPKVVRLFQKTRPAGKLEEGAPPQEGRLVQFLSRSHSS